MLVQEIVASLAGNGGLHEHVHTTNLVKLHSFIGELLQPAFTDEFLQPIVRNEQRV